MNVSITLTQEQAQELWVIVTVRLEHLRIERAQHTDPVLHQIIERQRERAFSILEAITEQKILHFPYQRG